LAIDVRAEAEIKPPVGGTGIATCDHDKNQCDDESRQECNGEKITVTSRSTLWRSKESERVHPVAFTFSGIETLRFSVMECPCF
jgi:hypothetical protein